MLKIFGAPFISFSVINEIVNELLQNDLEVIEIPRITIDDKLVVQRKGKIIPDKYLYNKNRKESKLEFIKKINEWRKDHQIPDLTFIKTIRKNKPQLIDFNSPLSVLVFDKILNSKPEAIIFSEMLPKKNDLLINNGAPYCTEFVFQWKKEK